jgi:type II secretory ATPase GspE/PulE/Tfp pilus assembly ATPase PilB-like protein
LSKHFGVPAVSLDGIKVDESIVKIIPADVARKYTILPIARSGAKVTIAMTDPTNVFAMDDIRFMTGYSVEPVVASENALRTAVDRYYGSTHAIELKKVMEEVSDAGAESLEVLTRSRISTSRVSSSRPRKRRWCGWSTSCSPTPSSAAPPTSTSSRTKRTIGSATASTGFSTK